MYDERSPMSGLELYTPPRMEHPRQNLSCLRSGVDYSRFTGSNTVEELLTTLLRQLNVCESGGVSHNNILEVKE